MDFNQLSDYEAIKIIQENGSKANQAYEFLLKKHAGLVKRELRTMFLIGAETEDLAQEGMIGLIKAIRSYEGDKGAGFSTFATLCIRRQMQTAVNTSNRKKHSPLNNYISFYAPKSEDGTQVGDDIEAQVSNPEDLMLAQEQQAVFQERIETRLSKLEKKVLVLYLDGYSYQGIAEELGKKEKSVDNALQRIRAKLSAE